MNSYKVIKTVHSEHATARDFNLQQFPGGEQEGANEKKKAKHAAGPRKIKKVKHDASLFSAKKITAEAQRTADSIIQQANQQAEQIRQDAFKQGLAKGIAEGTQKSEKKLSTLFQSFNEIAGQWQEIKTGFYDRHQDLLLELALKIARKIIHQEVTVNNDLIVNVLHNAIAQAIDCEKIEVRINPADMELCLKKRLEIIKDIDGIKQIIFEPDDSINRGGAIVEYNYGEIDARLEQQFAEVEDELLFSQKSLAEASIE